MLIAVGITGLEKMWEILNFLSFAIFHNPIIHLFFIDKQHTTLQK